VVDPGKKDSLLCKKFKGLGSATISAKLADDNHLNGLEMSLLAKEVQAHLGAAKITPPQVKDVVPRKELLRRLEQAKDRQLIFITGQAAQGKSTLAASYAQQAKEPMAWVNLGPEDSDAANLFYSIAYALSHLNERRDIPASAEQPATTTALRSEIPLYRGWSVSLFNLARLPSLLVLDGLDRLEKDSSALTFLSVLLAEAPAGFRVMLLSRTLPLKKMAEIEMDGKALLLDNRDLAFSESEAKALFKNRYAASIEKDEFLNIYQATEGWIGGLVILGETMARLPRDQKHLNNLGTTSQDFHQHIFQYFSDNMFDSFAPEVREILLKTSLFETIEPGFMNELLEDDQAEDVLTNLFNRNIFTTAHYDENKGTVFRYHNLFRNFLSQKLALKLTSEELNYLLARAGRQFEDRGNYEDALDCYFRAKAFQPAASVVNHLGRKLIQQGRHSDLSHWLESLPEELVRQDPWLLFYLCWSRRLGGFVENLRDLPKALEKFRSAGDIAGILYCLSFWIESLLVSGLSWDVVKPALDQAEALLKDPESESFPYERAILYIQLSSMHTLRGDPRKGYWAGRQALLIAFRLDDLILQLRAFPFVLTALTYLGEYAECENLVQEIDALMGDCRHPELWAKYLLSKTMYLIFAGDQQSGTIETKAFLQLVEKNGLMIFSSAAFLNRLVCSSLFEDFAQMESHLKFLPSILMNTPNPFIGAVLKSTAGNGLYRKGDLEAALDYLDKAIDSFSAQPGDSEFHLNSARIVRAMVHLGLNGSDPGGEDLEKAQSYFKEIGNQRLLAEATLALALMHWKQGSAEKAKGLLDQGLHLAQNCAHWHFLRISRKDAAQICLLGIEMASQPAVLYAASLLTGNLSTSIPSQRLSELAAHKDAAVAARAKDIQRALKRMAAPKLRVITFGGLQVLKDGEPLAAGDWGGTQPKLLLKAIINFGADKVPKDKLIGSLWPDKEHGAAEKSLKVALHKLRKALEPDMEKGVGSIYLILKQNLLSLDKELCQLDLDQFESLLQEARKSESEGKDDEAQALYMQAAGLYRGDFFSRDGHKDWLAARREDFRLDYIDALLKVSWLLEKNGVPSKAITWAKKALTADPTNEEACQRIMQLYGVTGKRALALKAYKEFEKRLQDDLDAKPDLLTTSIYEKLATS
jgi:LuxR family maltose regulon positive regulatory protein